ncbi:hypothetical protein Tco_1361461 [Tanacetum coccineum]
MENRTLCRWIRKSQNAVAKFTAIGICIYSDAWGLDELEKTLKQIKPYNSRLPAIDDVRNLIHRRTDHEKKAIAELAMQIDNASTTKDDLRKAYEKCNDIPQESRALINTFLKQESDKDYEMHLAMFRKAEK